MVYGINKRANNGKITTIRGMIVMSTIKEMLKKQVENYKARLAKQQEEILKVTPKVNEEKPKS